MLKEMIQASIKKALATDYAHLKLPTIVYARVDAVAKLDPFEIKELILFNDDRGVSCRGHIVAYWYEYKLTVLDRLGNPDQAFPPLPQIRSKKQFQLGAIVAAALPYGELIPSIIGEVRL